MYRIGVNMNQIRETTKIEGIEHCRLQTSFQIPQYILLPYILDFESLHL